MAVSNDATRSFDERWKMLCVRSSQIAAAKGWHEQPYVFTTFLALLHTEVSEAMEEYRAGHTLKQIYYVGEDNKPCGIPTELADLVIRIADYCGREIIDAKCASKIKTEHCYIDFPDYVLGLHTAISAVALSGYHGQEVGPGLMDLVKLAFDFAEQHGFSLWAAIEIKSRYNQYRLHRHGGKVC